ncbi:MAG: hypothetical protein ACE5NW_05995 [Acidiferrobacterales bacterium]
MSKKTALVKLLTQFGPLRLALACAAVVAIFSALEPGTPGVYTGWNFVPTVLIPVLVPLIFMVLMLDTLMSAVFLSGKEGVERRRFKAIMATNVVLAVGVLLAWLPYYLSLGQ